MELERELHTYDRERPALLAHEGKFVLIRGDDVSGVFDGYTDALRAGYERFGFDQFLVRQIRAVDPVEFIPFFELECRP
jgi:hypothetical protein